MSKREAVLQLVRTRRFVGATAAVLGLAGGSAAGYFYAYKKLEKKFNEDLDGEIEATKRFFAQYTKTGEYSDPVTLAEKYNDETISEEGYSSNSEDPEEIVILEDEKLIEPINVVRKNVFHDSEYSLEDELEKQARNEPWIVEEEMFHENMEEYSQTSLTYYSEDNIVAEDMNETQPDRLVNQWERVLGSENLKFGHGSEDPDVVYIRNDKLQAYYEVNFASTSYAHHVLGLQHSDDHRIGVRKFRTDWND